MSSELDEVKDYLYLETDIELDFQACLRSLSASKKKVVFLCGSSGDGKSEILTRYSKEFDDVAHFHLDATHSFSPKETAIEWLNKVFTNYDSGSKALVIGINIGMLGKYPFDLDNSRIDLFCASGHKLFERKVIVAILMRRRVFIKQP